MCACAQFAVGCVGGHRAGRAPSLNMGTLSKWISAERSEDECRKNEM
jgi:hypothetical protein